MLWGGWFFKSEIFFCCLSRWLWCCQVPRAGRLSLLPPGLRGLGLLPAGHQRGGGAGAARHRGHRPEDRLLREGVSAGPRLRGDHCCLSSTSSIYHVPCAARLGVREGGGLPGGGARRPRDRRGGLQEGVRGALSARDGALQGWMESFEIEIFTLCLIPTGKTRYIQFCRRKNPYRIWYCTREGSVDIHSISIFVYLIFAFSSAYQYSLLVNDKRPTEC